MRTASCAVFVPKFVGIHERPSSLITELVDEGMKEVCSVRCVEADKKFRSRARLQRFMNVETLKCL